MFRWPLMLIVMVSLIVWYRGRSPSVAADSSSPERNESSPLHNTEVPRRSEAEASSLPGPRSERLADVRPESGGASPMHEALDPGRLNLIGNSAPSREWPGWRCADIDDSSHRSLWTLESAEGSPPQIHDGTCAEWANRGPEGGTSPYPSEEGNDFAPYEPNGATI